MPTNVPAEVQIKNNPTLAVVDALRVRGAGQVMSVVERNALDDDIRKEGMHVWTPDGAEWVLNASPWAHNSSDWTAFTPPVASPITYPGLSNRVATYGELGTPRRDTVVQTVADAFAVGFLAVLRVLGGDGYGHDYLASFETPTSAPGDARLVFYEDDQIVNTIPITVTLPDGPELFTDMIARNDQVICVQTDTVTLYDVTGTASVRPAPGGSTFGGCAALGGAEFTSFSSVVFVTSPADKKIYFLHPASSSGTSPTLLYTTTINDPFGIVVDDAHQMWVASRTEAKISRFGRNGNPLNELVIDLPNIITSNLTTDGENIYGLSTEGYLIVVLSNGTVGGFYTQFSGYPFSRVAWDGRILWLSPGIVLGLRPPVADGNIVENFFRPSPAILALALAISSDGLDVYAVQGGGSRNIHRLSHPTSRHALRPPDDGGSAIRQDTLKAGKIIGPQTLALSTLTNFNFARDVVNTFVCQTDAGDVTIVLDDPVQPLRFFFVRNFLGPANINIVPGTSTLNQDVNPLVIPPGEGALFALVGASSWYRIL